MARFTCSTPDQPWLREVVVACKPLQDQISQLPVVMDALSLGRERRWLLEPRTQKTILEIGWGIIKIFPDCLEMMQSKAIPGSDLDEFLRANRETEETHWRAWRVMANEVGLFKDKFLSHRMTPAMAGLSDFLLYVSSRGSLPAAVSALNFTIETMAARLTRLIAPVLQPHFSERGGWWLEVHKRGDIPHARDARELLKQLAEDPAARQDVMDVAIITHELFLSALAAAY